MASNIEVCQLSEIKLVGITHIGEFDKIPPTYALLMEWAFSRGFLNIPQVQTVTIYHDNPHVTQKHKVRWSACLVVNDSTTGTEDHIRSISIRKGKYAVGHFEIDAQLISKAWDLVLVWTKNNGYEFGDHDYFELYYGDFRTHPEHKFIVDICIPIK